MMQVNAKDRKCKVLVIDDTAFVRKIVSKSLSELGVSDVVEVADAADAVRRLRGEHFDLVVSDWNLPTMSGFELLGYIRSHDRLKNTPFLMLTGTTDKDSVLAAFRSGVSDYLIKPFSAEDLEKKLVRLMPKEDTIAP
jgi:two-component system chemotaxis response regulator CheY